MELWCQGYGAGEGFLVNAILKKGGHISSSGKNVESK